MHCRVGFFLLLSLGIIAAATPSASADEFVWAKANMAVVDAEPGYAEVGPLKPTWCEQVKVEAGQDKNRLSGRIVRTMTSSQRSGFSVRNVSSLLTDLCAYPDDKGFQQQTGYVVQQWVNFKGQSQKDAIASMVARADEDAWDKMIKKGCARFDADDEATDEEENLAKARRALFGCRNAPLYKTRHSISDEYEWFIDRRAAIPSELDRLAYALQCLPDNGGELKKSDWVAIGLCRQDIVALDEKKIANETTTMNAAMKAIAAESVAKAKAELADIERAAAAKVKSDPDYRKLLYDAPRDAWNNWNAQYKRHKAAFDATFDFEKALFSSRKSATKSCYGGVEKGMLKFVKASKFKSREAFMEGVQGPIGSVLLNALAACYTVSSPADVGALLLKINEKSRDWRGPRAAARFAMIDTLSDIKADRDRFPLEFTHLQTRSRNLLRKRAMSPERSKIPRTGGRYNERKSGVVKSIKKAKGVAETRVADFNSTTWTEPKYSCVDTKKVNYVRDGRVYYRRKCKKVGTMKKKYTPQDTLFFDWSAKGIKANSFVIMSVPVGSEHGNKARAGYPIEVYQNKNRKKLLNMYGFKL